jgi:uncharacterized membrane protein (UPF0127 family)
MWGSHMLLDIVFAKGNFQIVAIQECMTISTTKIKKHVIQNFLNVWHIRIVIRF